MGGIPVDRKDETGRFLGLTNQAPRLSINAVSLPFRGILGDVMTSRIIRTFRPIVLGSPHLDYRFSVRVFLLTASQPHEITCVRQRPPTMKRVQAVFGISGCEKGERSSLSYPPTLI